MTTWMERAKAHFLQESQEHTDKTDESGVMSVSSVCSRPPYEKKQGVSSVSSAHSWRSYESPYGHPLPRDRLELPDSFETRITALLRYQVIDGRLASALRTLWQKHKDAAETKLFRLEVESNVTPCDRCRHARKPGATVYCSARNDLEPVYGINHPLRQVPLDRGHTCDEFLGAR